MASVPSPQPKEGRWIFRKSHSSSGITFPTASLLLCCFYMNTWSFRVGWPHTGRASSDTECLPVLHVLVPRWCENRILFSFKSYNMVGAHIFLSLTFHIYWAFIPYPMFFGEHFLGGGSSVHVKAPAETAGHCSVKWGDWLILPRPGWVPGGWQERESTVDQK